jgi:hypothetical protein
VDVWRADTGAAHATPREAAFPDAPWFVTFLRCGSCHRELRDHEAADLALSDLRDGATDAAGATDSTADAAHDMFALRPAAARGAAHRGGTVRAAVAWPIGLLMGAGRCRRRCSLVDHPTLLLASLPRRGAPSSGPDAGGGRSRGCAFVQEPRPAFRRLDPLSVTRQFFNVPPTLA